MLNGSFKIVRYLFLAVLLCNLLAVSINCVDLPRVRICSLRIELLNERGNQIRPSCWSYSKAKSKLPSSSNSKRFYTESLIFQNRFWKTRLIVQNILSFKVHKSDHLLRSVPPKFADESSRQVIG